MSRREDRRLQAIYDSIPVGPCDGCHECGGKCAGEIRMTREESRRVREALGAGHAIPRAERASGEMLPPCRFYDATAPGCSVYEARPLICRLFGLVEWLPCPTGRRGVEVADGAEIMQWYATLELRTFDEWLQERSLTHSEGHCGAGDP